jgi:ferredoxin
MTRGHLKSMKIIICYFSGTGNTAWVTHRLAEQLEMQGDAVRVVSCEDVPAANVDPAEWDMLGIAFPVHSSFAPRVFREYLQELVGGEGTPLFAVTSAGYWAGDTAWYAAKELEAKGYRLFLYGNVRMPNNLYIPRVDVLPVTPPEKVPGYLEKAREKIERLARRIHQEEPYREGTDVVGRLGGALQRLGSEKFEEAMLAKFSADEGCTRCGWCVRSCPAENIEMEEKGVRFLGKCMYCMRCYSFCPEQAIQATERTRRTEKYRRYQGPEGKRYPRSERRAA